MRGPERHNPRGKIRGKGHGQMLGMNRVYPRTAKGEVSLGTVKLTFVIASRTCMNQQAWQGSNPWVHVGPSLTNFPNFHPALRSIRGCR